MRKAFEAGQLNDAEISAAATSRRKDFVYQALALKAAVPLAAVERIMVSRSGKAVTALVWKAGLGMRTALAVQKDIGQVPKSDTVLARNGVDYPMDEEEMRWHLQFFGVEG